MSQQHQRRVMNEEDREYYRYLGRGFALLHSTKPDSTQKLRELFLEVTRREREKRNTSRRLRRVNNEPNVSDSEHSAEEENESEAEKKVEESVKEESDLNGNPEVKHTVKSAGKKENGTNANRIDKPKASGNGNGENSSNSSTTPSPSSLGIVKEELEEMNIVESTSGGCDNAVSPENVEILLRCRVCKKSGQEDLLAECQECHEYYHKGCHKPPIPENELKDPRMVWYCSSCAQTTTVSFSKVERASGNNESLKLTFSKYTPTTPIKNKGKIVEAGWTSQIKREPLRSPDPKSAALSISAKLGDTSLFKRKLTDTFKSNDKKNITTPLISTSTQPSGMAAWAARIKAAKGGKPPVPATVSALPDQSHVETVVKTVAATTPTSTVTTTSTVVSPVEVKGEKKMEEPARQASRKQSNKIAKVEAKVKVKSKGGTRGSQRLASLIAAAQDVMGPTTRSSNKTSDEPAGRCTRSKSALKAAATDTDKPSTRKSGIKRKEINHAERSADSYEDVAGGSSESDDGKKKAKKPLRESRSSSAVRSSKRGTDQNVASISTTASTGKGRFKGAKEQGGSDDSSDCDLIIADD